MAGIPISQTTSTIASTGGKGAMGLLSSLWRYKFILLTIIALIIILWSAVLESYQERSFEPLVNEVGGRIFLIDKNIQLSVQNANQEGYINSTKFIFEIMSQLWILFFLVKSLIWIIGKTPLSNESNWFVNFALAILFLYILMTGYCLTYNENFGIEEKSCFQFFGGVRSLLGMDVNENQLIVKIKSFFDKRLESSELPVGMNASMQNISFNLTDS